VGCVVQIGQALYGLTASHAVRLSRSHAAALLAKDPGRELDTISYGPITSTALDCSGNLSIATGTVFSQTGEFTIQSVNCVEVDDTCENGDFIIDEVEYDDFPDDGEDDDSINGDRPLGAYSSAPEALIIASQEGGIETTAIFPADQSQNTSNDPDLDWAIINLKEREQLRPNAFINTEDPSHPVFFSEVATTYPKRETAVFIITSRYLVKKGMLQPVSSFLGGINGNRASTVWSVIMSDGNGKCASSKLSRC
jgi:hypothetical protein